MKGKVKNMKKVNIEPIMFSRKGAGRIDENIPIDLLEYVTQRSAEVIDDTPLCYIPKQITVSEEINGTIYDVTGIFTGEVNKSLFQQLKELILSERLV